MKQLNNHGPMGRYELSLFVQNELKELESRDSDTLYACLCDNLSEMSIELTESQCDALYAEIERQLKLGGAE